MVTAMNPPAFTIEPMKPAQAQAWLQFFDHVAFADNPRWSGCYCQFPTANHQAIEWKQRSAAENRASACRRIEAGLQRGVVALADGAIIGWCNAGPWRSTTIFDEPPEADMERLAAVTCFVVAPSWRQRGVSQALLQGACAMLQREGFEAVAAWARPGETSDTGNHTGSFTHYQRAGFAVWRDNVDGGVLVRKDLSPSASAPP